MSMQNDDKKYLLRHNNSTAVNKCQKILNKIKKISLLHFIANEKIFLKISTKFYFVGYIFRIWNLWL